jgi:hypothetical protein
MAVITLFAPATRIGYLLYPINFFVWAYLFSGTPGTEQPGARAPVTEEDLQLKASADSPSADHPSRVSGSVR